MSSLVLQVRSRAVPSGAIEPLYLFACQVEWCKRYSEEAGSELLCALVSPDAETRAVARALLEACK